MVVHSADVGEMRLRLAQSLALFIRASTFGHVHRDPVVFAGAARRVGSRMTDDVHVSHRTIGDNQSELQVHVRSGARRGFKGLHQAVLIVRMNTLKKLSEWRQGLLGIEAKQTGMFVGGVDRLSGHEISRPAAGPGEPLRFGQIGLAAPQGFFGALLTGQIEHERDAVAAVLFEAGRTDQHRHAAAVFPRVLLLERLDGACRLDFCDGSIVTAAPFRRRQVGPAHASRHEILTAVGDRAEKRVVGVGNFTREVPDEHPDDIGVDQAPDLRGALFEITVHTLKQPLAGQPPVEPRRGEDRAQQQQRRHADADATQRRDFHGVSEKRRLAPHEV
jgi:hypothetical protein